MNPNTDPSPSFLRLSPPLAAQSRIVGGAFLLIVLAGYLLNRISPSVTGYLVDSFSQSVEESGMLEMGRAEMMISLFVNNCSATGSAILSGFCPFLFLPAMSLALNALLLGTLAAYYQTSGPGLALFLAGTLPHGVTELTALAVSCAAGLLLCGAVTDRLLRRKDAPPISAVFRDCFHTFLRLILPLLVFSAAVEVYITPAVMEMFS